ncbi:MAG: hypothetical protein J1F25_05610 [Prevotellaceae bacterium]|nr:hypothetical protein [Prevotellaceae bacterium]
MNEILNIVDNFLQQGKAEQAFNLLQQVVDKTTAEYQQRDHACRTQLHDSLTGQIQQAIAEANTARGTEFISKYRAMLGQNAQIDELEQALLCPPPAPEPEPEPQPAPQPQFVEPQPQFSEPQPQYQQPYQPQQPYQQQPYGQQPYQQGYVYPQQPSKPMWQSIGAWNKTVLGFVGIGVWFLALLINAFSNDLTVTCIFSFFSAAAVLLVMTLIYAQAAQRMKEGTNVGIALFAGGGILLIFYLILIFVDAWTFYKTYEDLKFLAIIAAAALSFTMFYAFFRVSDFAHRVPALLFGSAYAAKAFMMLITLSSSNDFATFLDKLADQTIYAALLLFTIELAYDNYLKPKRA